MTATNAAMTATQAWVPLANPSALAPGFYTIDSENIRVRASEHRTTDTDASAAAAADGLFVERGVGGSTAASHSTNATLTAYYPDAAGGGGGSISELEDPGVAWQAEHAYAIGDRFRETVQGKVRVFEVITAGTSGAGAFADYVWEGLLVPGVETGTGTEGFVYLGVVGQLAWASILPGFSPTIEVGGDGETNITSPQAPADSVALIAMRAMVAGSPVSVFEMKSDGDSDWKLDENTGAGMRWNRSADGGPAAITGRFTEITTDRFAVARSDAPAGSFEVYYADPNGGTGVAIYAHGLPTANPNVSGRLWNDSGTLKVSAG